MGTLGSEAYRFLGALGSAGHLPAAEGDYIGADGRLHCGKCGRPREFRLPCNGRYVSCRCGCDDAMLERERQADRLREEQERVREMQRYSLADERFRLATFDRFRADGPEDRRVLDLCRNYVEHFDRMYAAGAGLLFRGRPGTGKTFAAGCIANALMARRVPVLVTSLVRLTAEGDGDALNRLLPKMNAARLLVLDDFGAERDTEFKAEQVFSVIDARYAAKKPMILTTNLDGFTSVSDPRRRRVYDRILEVCTPVPMNGESRRLKEAELLRGEIRPLLRDGAAEPAMDEQRRTRPDERRAEGSTV